MQNCTNTENQVFIEIGQFKQNEQLQKWKTLATFVTCISKYLNHHIDIYIYLYVCENYALMTVLNNACMFVYDISSKSL